MKAIGNVRKVRPSYPGILNISISRGFFIVQG
jgi:hypothetical protein